MNIIYLAATAIPSRAANSIHVMKMCQALAQNGHKVTLIVPKFRCVEPDVDDVCSFYGVDRVFQIIMLPWFPIKGKTFIYSIWAALKAKQLQPDLVYGRFLQGCYFCAIFGIPVAFESHAPVEESGLINARFFNRLIAKVNFKRLIVISEALRRHYATKYPQASKYLTVAHDGADPIDERMPLATEVRPERKLRIGYVGQLYKGKGMELMAELAPRCPWAEFHIIGGIPSEIDFWRTSLAGVENIFFYGFLPHSEAVKYSAIFDVMLAPYQRQVTVHGGSGDVAKWMSPLKIFEYMAAGKAIVCSDLPVLREILVHEENSLLCDPESINEWALALESLRESEALRAKLGEAAKVDFEKHYSWRSRAYNILRSIYQ